MRFLLLLVVVLSSPAVAGERCRVHEATGKSVTVRPDVKGGPTVTLKAGQPVDVVERVSDRGGAPWVKLADRGTGEALGWVAKEAVSCF